MSEILWVFATSWVFGFVCGYPLGLFARPRGNLRPGTVPIPPWEFDESAESEERDE